MKKTFKKLIDEYGTMQLLGSDGNCACGSAKLFGIEIETHCHRSTCESDHKYSCVHVGGNTDMGIVMKDVVDLSDMIAEYIAKAYATEVETETILE